MLGKIEVASFDGGMDGDGRPQGIDRLVEHGHEVVPHEHDQRPPVRTHLLLDQVVVLVHGSSGGGEVVGHQPGIADHISVEGDHLPSFSISGEGHQTQT